MKIALIAFGNEESYGLLFVAGELLEFKQEIRFFDAEEGGFIEKIVEYRPDFAFFSPLTSFFNFATEIARKLKDILPNLVTVFGGHHVTSYQKAIELDEIDIIVAGPVRGSIEQVFSRKKGLIKTNPTDPNDLASPAREKYYNDIPRMRNRYRKVMSSMFGCPWNCSYCSASSKHLRELYGIESHKRYFLTRRSVSSVIAEAKEILKLGSTEEIEWTDDDIFSGYQMEEWLSEFIDIWTREIKLPMYVSTTSKSVLNVSNKLLYKLKSIVNCIGMGIQAIRPGSLKLLNRPWDNEKQMKEAYDRCVSFGFSVNLQAIVGLPVEDTVEDALETVKAIQRIGPKSICSVYPLQVYPGTDMEKYCIENKFEFNPLSTGDTNTGIPSVLFSDKIIKEIRNICKLATFFVKYDVDEEWMRVLLDIDFDEETSKNLSWERYHECVLDRLKLDGERVFQNIFQSTKLRY